MGAAYLIRDCGFKGKNIHIIEGMHILGGSNDGAGNSTQDVRSIGFNQADRLALGKLMIIPERN